MVTLHDWAVAWGVPYAALEDLRRRLGMVDVPLPPGTPGVSEATVQSRVRVEASEAGARLWRNNVGALQDERGRWVRYGLCNESRQQNTRLKSSDLIGIKPIRIAPYHIGQVIGQFIAREVKPQGWTYAGDAHEVAQLAFLDLVLAFGGDAAFVTGPGSIDTGGNSQ